jgi:hypothetical protein
MLPIIRCFRSPAPINFSILAKALTRKINGYLELVNSISRSYADKNIGPSKKIIGKSYPGARMGLEPMCAIGAYEDFLRK